MSKEDTPKNQSDEQKRQAEENLKKEQEQRNIKEEEQKKPLCTRCGKRGHTALRCIKPS